MLVGSIICLLLLCSLSYQPLIADDTNGWRTYEDVHIILISRKFMDKTIIGFHLTNEGLGYDEYVELSDADRLPIFGFILIYDDTRVWEKYERGGYVHMKIRINGYGGWMFNQHTNKHWIMFGDCDILEVWSH